MMSMIKGIYPCGEGAGYAGGITSAAMDGVRVAEAIIKKYRPKGLTSLISEGVSLVSQVKSLRTLL